MHEERNSKELNIKKKIYTSEAFATLAVVHEKFSRL